MDPDTLWPSGQAYYSCGRCLPFQWCWTAGSDQEAQKSSAESVLWLGEGTVRLEEFYGLKGRVLVLE